jgi:5'-phosphate synthase pdxT subunit
MADFPGGDSTSISKLMIDYYLLDAVRTPALDGMALWGTCAGMILLAKNFRTETPAASAHGLKT